MSRPLRTWLMAAASAALLSACTDDPFERPGTVAPRGFNDANLRAMAVDPAHLRRGVGASTIRGDAAASAIDLLRSGKRKNLPSSGTARALTGEGGSDNGGQ